MRIKPREYKLQDGRNLTVRSVEGEDAAAYAAGRGADREKQDEFLADRIQRRILRSEIFHEVFQERDRNDAV